MIQLSHIGEELVTQMLCHSESVRHHIYPELGSFSNSLAFVSELGLSKCGVLGFDGAHRIDVAILNEQKRICYPIELKLGFSGLSKKSFEDRFLRQCGESHNGSRVRGSMISVLERKLPPACQNHDLTIEWQGQNYSVSRSWTLIARKRVITNWAKSGAPELSSCCRIVDFESLVSTYGSNEAFNTLVKKLINIDYYREWLFGDSDA